MRTSIVLSLFVASAGGAAAEPLDVFRARQEERARAEVSDLLKTLCPEQCVLLSASAQVDTEPPPDALPGLTDEDANRPVLRGTRAQVAIDSALPRAFRDRLETLVEQRLRGLGAPARVGIETVTFPPRRAEAQPVAAPPPPPQIITLQSPAPVPAATPTPPVVEAPPLERAARALADASPWLLLGAIIVLAWALRRGGPTREPGLPPSPPLVEPSTAAAETQRFTRRLQVLDALAQDRAAAARVLDEALLRGETRRVAVWLRELGNPLVELVRPEAAVRPGLAEELSTAAPAAEEIAEELSVLAGRMTAARLGAGAQGGQDTFEFLHRHPVADVRSAMLALGEADRALVLRFSPSTVRDAVLPVLPAAERLELAVRWARGTGAARHDVVRAAERMQAALARHGGVSSAREALGDVLSTFSASEQKALLAELEGSLAEPLVVEESLAQLPLELVTRAVLQVAPGELATWLGGADPAHRACVLEAAPRTLRRELEEELAQRASPLPDEYRKARRALLRAVEDELRRIPSPGSRREAS